MAKQRISKCSRKCVLAFSTVVQPNQKQLVRDVFHFTWILSLHYTTLQRQATLPKPFVQFPALLYTRRHLRSADTSTLLVPTTRRSTLGDRTFPAAAARAWNSLHCHVSDMPSLLTFHRELKTVLFRLSYPVDWQFFSTVTWHWHCKVVLQQ